MNKSNHDEPKENSHVIKTAINRYLVLGESPLNYVNESDVYDCRIGHILIIITVICFEKAIMS